MYRKNTAGQYIGFRKISSTDGSDKSGVPTLIRRDIDGAGFATATGTVVVDIQGATRFQMSQADTNGQNIFWQALLAGMITDSFNVLTDSNPPDVNVADINRVATTSVTTVNANIGTTQPQNFTGTGASALVQTDVTDWKAATAPAMTGDAYARLGAPAGASVSADVAAVKSDTAAIKTATNTGVAPGANGGLLIIGSNLGSMNLTGLTTPIVASSLTIGGTATIAQTGDAYARIGLAGVGLTNLGDTRIAHLDADVSSRLASASYTAPDNANIVLARKYLSNQRITYGSGVNAGKEIVLDDDNSSVLGTRNIYMAIDGTATSAYDGTAAINRADKYA